VIPICLLIILEGLANVNVSFVVSVILSAPHTHVVGVASNKAKAVFAPKVLLSVYRFYFPHNMKHMRESICFTPKIAQKQHKNYRLSRLDRKTYRTETLKLLHTQNFEILVPKGGHLREIL
jgi:hypothetical protein